jgi:hypothetical protein
MTNTAILRERSTASFLLSLLVLLGANALEAAAAVMIVRGPSAAAWIGVAAAHVAAAGLSAEGVYLRRRATSKAGSTLGLYQAGWLIGLAFPLFGPAAVLLLSLSLPEPKPEIAALESLEEQRSRAASAALERRRGEQQLDRGLEAIVDALEDRDPRRRIAAIDALTGDASPRAAKILADARENTVFDVRVRAVQALAKLTKEHGDRLGAAKKLLAADPRSPEKNREVAALCFDYAALGVEDAKMSRMLFEQARLHAETAAALGDDSRGTMLVLARALGELDRHEEAEAIYRNMLIADDRDAGALMGVVESQFARRAFALLPLTSRWVLHQAGSALDQAATDSLKFWMRGAGAESPSRRDRRRRQKAGGSRARR